MITLEYPQHEMDGPPFSVDADEVAALFGERWDVDLLEHSDILAAQPTFRESGVTALHTGVHRLQRKPAAARR